MEFLHFLETIRSVFATTFFSFITYLGEEITIIAVLCLIYWCIDKKLGYKISFAYFVSGLFVQTLKITARIDRPWILDPTLNPVPSALETATGYSFPSGHTQSATALLGSLAFHSKQMKKKIICFVLIGLVALSRMYLGVHTPKDVLVSFFVSIILVIAANFIFQKREQETKRKQGTEKGKKKENGIYIFMFLVSIFVAVYAVILLSNQTIEEKYAMDCCKAAGAGFGLALGWMIEERYIQFKEDGYSILGQLIKYIIGISIAVLLKVGLKEILGSSILTDMIRYMILVLWVTVGYPFLIKTVSDKRVKE